MKKILSYCLVATIVLGMASCGGDEPHLKNFKVEFKEETQTRVRYIITPANGQEAYRQTFVTKTEFLQLGVEEITSGKWYQGFYGEQSFAAAKLYPASEYVVIIFPVYSESGNKGSWERSGEPEYIFFTTSDWPNRMDGEIPGTQEGEVRKMEKSIRITGSVLGDQQFQVDLYATNPEGRFTKKDLNAYDGDYTSFFQIYPIYDIDFTGKYDAANNKYIYEGWFMISDEKYSQGVRYNFKMSCSPIVVQ